jgi:hypothetical protein
MALKTALELAEAYQDAYISLIEGQLQSYSVNGKSYQRKDLEVVHRLFLYWKGEAHREDYGIIAKARMNGGI